MQHYPAESGSQTLVEDQTLGHFHFSDKIVISASLLKLSLSLSLFQRIDKEIERQTFELQSFEAKALAFRESI